MLRQRYGRKETVLSRTLRGKLRGVFLCGRCGDGALRWGEDLCGVSNCKMESSVMGAGAALGEDLCGAVRAGWFELLGG